MEKIIKLIKAICIRVQELESYINKTKLIKLLYLIDVEYYRRYKKTFTGFNWIFYEFGPWAHEYNEIYDIIKSSPNFRIEQKGHIKEGEVLQPEFIKYFEEEIDLEDIFPTLEEKTIFFEIVDRWGKENLSEILNYVYFYTEPMLNARKRKPLDFHNIEIYGKVPKYKRRKSGVSEKRIAELREKLKSLKLEEKISKKQRIRPRYDELYFSVINKLDRDYDY